MPSSAPFSVCSALIPGKKQNRNQRENTTKWKECERKRRTSEKNRKKISYTMQMEPISAWGG
jgi:hypothetical protein